MAEIGVGNTTNKRRLRDATLCFETPENRLALLTVKYQGSLLSGKS